MTASPSRPKLLFFITVDWFFCSHFMSRAIAAQKAGFEILVLTKVHTHGAQIEQAGFKLIPLDISRRTLNPITSFVNLLTIIRIYDIEDPDIIHHIALKPILLGGLAAKILNKRHIVNAVVGGGYLFSSASLAIRIARPFLTNALKRIINPHGSKVIFENADDLNSFVEEKYVKQQDAVLIRGAGVNPKNYIQASFHSNTPTVLLAARLLWDKGIGEFVTAARQLKSSGITAKFVVVGGVDTENRASIDEDTLKVWHDEGVVEFWGFRSDIPQILANASIVCLPSYREGLPKILLEAMAAGLPCVTTDVPGCREAVKHGYNGLLAQPQDADELAEALEILINNPDMQKKMGLRGQKRIENEFSSDIVIKETLTLYNDILQS